MKKGTIAYEFLKGLWAENPVLVMVLGMCPTLAVSNTVINGFAMSLAVLFVLSGSNLMVSIIRKIIPSQVRLPVFIIIISTFVTIADLFIKAQFPDISKALGPFVPLIIVNCIIIARAEAFASKRGIWPSIVDAIGMSFGFMWVLVLLGIIREFLGFGSLGGFKLLGPWFTPWVIMLLPPGAFVSLGILVGLKNQVMISLGKRRRAS
ncbi:MAG: electron transport complex subunit E [candidate division WOR-3 bacterium]